MKKTLSLLILFIALSYYQLTAQEDRNCFGINHVSRTFDIPAQSKPLRLKQTNTPEIIVTINGDKIIAPVLTSQFGVTTTFRNGNTQIQRQKLYSAAGINVLRFPGGSGSNQYFWDGNIPTNVSVKFKAYNGTTTEYLSPEEFVRFKTAIHSNATVVVNYFYARYGQTTAGTREARVKQAAEYAAGFVRKMNVELKAGITYWEIGNECYGNWEVGHKIDTSEITGKEYGEDFCVFAKAMKALDPTIKVGVVVTREDEKWNSGVLPEVKYEADFLVVHNYFTWVKLATPRKLQESLSQVESVKRDLQADVVAYTGKSSDYFPIAMTEFNSRGIYNCSMNNGLFITQVLGEAIRNNYGMLCLWNSESYWSVKEQESKGFLAVNDPDQKDYTPRPSYVPYYYFAKCFGDNMVEAESTNDSLKVYASWFSSGEQGVVLVNISSKTQNVSFKSQARSFKNIWLYEFYSDSVTPENKKFYVNGLTSNTRGGGPDLDKVLPYKASVKANSVLLVRPQSVSFLVMR